MMCKIINKKKYKMYNQLYFIRDIYCVSCDKNIKICYFLVFGHLVSRPTMSLQCFLKSLEPRHDDVSTLKCCLCLLVLRLVCQKFHALL